MDVLKEIEKLKEEIDEALALILPLEFPERLFEAMSYSVFAGGKRMRPILLLAACRAAGGNEYHALPFACALEMIHTYSLIHDDLPAMDNDDLRRGKPSSHKAFGEALAILAGDGLLNTAYETMARACLCRCNEEHVAAMSEIAEAAGARGMVGGQVVDTLSENEKIDENTLLYIHGNKTAALIKAALKAGAILGGADDDTLTLFEQAGVSLGMAFQIKDDILDATSTQEALGKPVNSDSKNKKATYISVYGMEKARDDYEKLSAHAIQSIEQVGDPFLTQYAKHLFERNA